MSDRLALVDQFDAAEPAEPDAPPTTLDIVIDPPIEFAKKPFTVLHLREPKAGEMQAALAEIAIGSNPLTQHKMATRLVAAVAKVPIEVVLQLPDRTVQRAMDFFTSIGDAGRPTGES